MQPSLKGFPFRTFNESLTDRFPKTGNDQKQTVMIDKKRAILILVSTLLTLPIHAQIGGIEDSVNDIADTIRGIFPIILGVIFLVGFPFNAGHFFGENADLKKGITRVLVFVLIAGAVVGIFTYLIGIVL